MKQRIATYNFLAKGTFESKISAIDWHGKVLSITICHCKVDLYLDTFAPICAWVFI